ncbi:MAG: thioredoxin family protein [Ignavibacteria bacterium]|nr:thioredoxin family protein [Ignavibacteria bacterium]
MPAFSNPDNTGIKIIDFSLKGIDGKLYSPADFKDKDILIIIFKCNHCPYVKAVMDRLVSFQKKYRDKKVQLIGINPNDAESYPEDSFDNMKLFAEKYKMNFPYLIDETQEVARKYDAVCTPDIYVYDIERKLRYRGRLDDSWKDENKIMSKDLEHAVGLLLEGKEIDFEQIPSMGCSIKWKVAKS